VVIGPYDGETGEVVSYEDLVGSHGGLGGRQQEPFLLHPVDLAIDDALVGAPAVHAELRRWLSTWRAARKPMRRRRRRDRPVGSDRRTTPAHADGAGRGGSRQPRDADLTHDAVTDLQERDGPSLAGIMTVGLRVRA